MALQLLLFLVVLFGKGWRSEQGAKRNREEVEQWGRCWWDFHVWLCSEGSCSVTKQQRQMRGRKKSACSEWLPFGRMEEINSPCHGWDLSLSRLLGAILPRELGVNAGLSACFCLARNGRGSQRREKGGGTQETILSWPFCERVSHPPVSSTHLHLPSFSLSWVENQNTCSDV